MIQLTPKQKAKELVFRFYKIVGLSGFEYDCVLPIASLDNYYHKIAQRRAKKCALKCANEVLGYMGSDRGYAFWEEVKQEIKKL